jgi:hypothetical protein
MSTYPCCKHCDPGDHWHMTRARGAHADLCPDGCNSAQGGEFRTVHFDRGGIGISLRCGNRDWYQMTAAEKDVTCQKCISLVDGTWAVGRRWCDAKPCGTDAAERNHRRHGEKIDEACRLAANRASADRKARRRRNRKALAA